MKSIAHPGAEPPPRARREAVAPPAFISIIRTAGPRHLVDATGDRVLRVPQRRDVRGGQFPAREAFWGGRGPGRIKSNLRQPPDALRFGLQGFVERLPLPPVLRRGALAGDAGPLGRVVAGAAPRRCGGRRRASFADFWSLCSAVVCSTQINRSDANLPCRGLSVDDATAGAAQLRSAHKSQQCEICACRGFSV